MSSPETRARQRLPALAPIHDFAAKLRQEGLRGRLEAYVTWRRAVEAARAAGAADPASPLLAPVSINLDLTTACNFACDHCIDHESLNTGVTHDEGRLCRALESMADRGLRSVILIGGGEPTVHPGFGRVVRFLKDRELQVAVVSNGSRNDRILEVIDRLDERDWIRLSLDAGTDETFQAMHRPRRPVTLGEICAGVSRLKSRNPAPPVGFSFVIVWEGAERSPGVGVRENVDEIPLAARRARESGFDYVSFKPFLVRTPEGAEVMDPEGGEGRPPFAETLRRIRDRLEQAQALATPEFAVLESTNLKLLETDAWRDWTRQPRTCHMQAFRQVLSPLGLFNCPAHRGVPEARIEEATAHADEEGARRAVDATAALLDRFDASVRCREVTCLYHATNWWIEAAVRDGLDGIRPATGEDYFL